MHKIIFIFISTLSYISSFAQATTLVAVPQSSNVFNDIPYGFNFVKVTNECKQSKVLNLSVYNTDPVNFTHHVISNNTCKNSSKIYVSSNVSKPISYKMLKHPRAYKLVIPIISNKAFVNYEDLIPGNYKVEAVDACGSRDVYEFEIRDDTSQSDWMVTTEGCGDSDHRIQAKLGAAYTDRSAEFKLFDEKTTSQIESNKEGLFTDLDTGTYILVLEVCGEEDLRDTIHFDAYQPLNISTAFGVPSDDGTVFISCLAKAGKPPYLFDIIEGPELRSQQSEPVFENLAPGNNYTVRVEDACGQTFQREISVDTFPKIYIAEKGRSCVGKSLTLEADTIGGASYIWFGPNNFISNARRIEFPALRATDSGLYTLTISLGDYAVEKTILKQLQTTENYPVELAYFKTNYKPKEKKVYLNWETHSEINVAFFEIQRSSNGIDWTMIDVIEAKGGEQKTVNYALVDKQPLPSMSHYRLLMIDYEGSNSSSDAEKVFRDMTKTIKVVPNPVRADNVDIFLKQGPDSGDLFIIDHMGRPAISQSFLTEKLINVNIESLPAGIYYAKVRFSDGTYFTEKFIKIGE